MPSANGRAHKGRRSSARHRGHEPHRRLIVVKVGLSWRNGDRRWKSVWQPFLSGVVRDVSSRLAAKGLVESGARVAEVRRLRASAGRCLMESILEDIECADVLAFDLTPRIGEAAGPANVLVELGAALALDKRVFLAAASPKRIVMRCSDVSGHYVAPIAGTKFDASLRMALVHAIAREWIRVNGAGNDRPDMRSRQS